MAIYYVDGVSGSDSTGSGTSAAPWKTLQGAHDKAAVTNSDTVRVRTATYYEAFRLTKAGVTFTADTGHTPTINGRYDATLFGAAGYTGQTGGQISAGELPYPNKTNANKGNWVYYGADPDGEGHRALVVVSGAGSKLIDFVIRNSCGRLLGVEGNNVEIRNCRLDFSYGGCTYLEAFTGIQFIGNVLTRGSIKYFDPTRGDPTKEQARKLVQTSCIIKARDSLIQGNTVCFCYGEGISADKGSSGLVIEDNTCHTCHNWAMGFNGTKNTIFRRNVLTWCENLVGAMDKPATKDAPASCADLFCATDEEKGGAASFGVQIYNNLMVGGKRSFLTGDGQRVTTLSSVYIGYNTIVGRPTTIKDTFNIGSPKTGESHNKTVIENNIILKHPQQPGGLAKVASSAGITFRNNLYNAVPPTGMRGTGDRQVAAGQTVLDNAVTPAVHGTYNKLSTDLPTVTTTLAVGNYDVADNSDAIGRASNRSNVNGLILPVITTDRYGDGRTDMDAANGRYYDIGADEAGGTVAPPTPVVTAAFSLSPAATSIVTGTAVTFTNQSVVANTTVSGYQWVVKRGTATIFNSTATNLGSYTFGTAGTWTVALTVNTAAGVSDTETVTLTVTDPGGDPSVTAAFSRSPSTLSLVTGASVSFADQSVIENTTRTGQTWEVRTSPGDVLVTSATTSSFSHTFDTAGTFVVKLTVTTAAGLSDTETVTYTVTDPAITVTADFTASETIINEGESITFTNASAATGTTITGYSWTFMTDGAAGAAETEDVTYTFTRAGTWEVGLTVYTAADVSAAKSIFVTVRVVDSYGAGLYKAMVVPYRVAVNTSTGEQTITTAALGTLIPKAATVRLTAAVTDGTAAAGALWSEGATDGASQWSMCRFSQDGATGGVGKRRFDSGILLRTIDQTGAVTGQATFARFVAGGMVINITDAFPAAYLMEVDFYAGDELTAAAGTALIGALGIDTPVTTGIDQDFIYAATTWAADGASAATADADMSRGFAVKSGGQACFRYQDRDGVATTALNTRHSGSYVAFSGDGSTGTNVYVQAHSFTTSGFKLRPYSNSMADRPLGWLAVSLGGPGVALATVALDTGASSEHVLPFEAQTALALVATTATADAAVTDTTAEGQGYYATSIYSSGAEYTTWIASSDGAGTSDTVSWSDNAFRAIDHDGSNKWNGAGTLGATALDVAWTNAPAAAHLMILLGMEIAEALPEDPPDDPPPTADFTADVRSGTTRLLVRFDSSATNDNGAAITAYLWDFGDGTTSTAANPAHLYSREGEFTVTLTVTNAGGSSTVTKDTYIVAAHPKRERYLVGPVRPLSTSSARGNDMPTGYTGDADTDEQVGYHAHDHESVRILRLKAMTTAEIAAKAAESDGAHAQVMWNSETNAITVITTDGTIRTVATS